MKHTTYKTHSRQFYGTHIVLRSASEQLMGLCTNTSINVVRTYVILCAKISMECTGYCMPTLRWCKGKAGLKQVSTGREESRRLKLPEFLDS